MRRFGPAVLASAMPWLESVNVRGHFRAPDFNVKLRNADDGFRHLILTGPNGSGKTTILRELARQTELWIQGERFPKRGAFEASVRWYPKEVGRHLFASGEFLAAFIPMHRQLKVRNVSGPSVFQLGATMPTQELYSQFLQYLVNQHVQARLAATDDPESAQLIFAWLSNFETSLGELLEVPGLKLRFNRKSYDITFVEPGGLEYAFAQLPSGFAAVLLVLAEITLRMKEFEHPALSGVIFIDEIDAFLHPSLQERILPFLVDTYPRLQFVVATHSAAIATSLRNAQVVALDSGTGVSGEELAGTPYGRLLTGFFGIETDVDLATTEDLHELKRLWELDSRTADEDQMMRMLAGSLQKTANPIALEIGIALLMEEAD